MTAGEAIEAARAAAVLDRLAGDDLTESQPEIYDRPIGLRLLSRDPRTGAEHYLVRYPAGVRCQRHTHSAAHTIVVIDGALEVDGELLPTGSYAHFPAGTPMRHQPAPGRDCLFVILFDGPFDVQQLDHEVTEG